MLHDMSSAGCPRYEQMFATYTRNCGLVMAEMLGNCIGVFGRLSMKDEMIEFGHKICGTETVEYTVIGYLTPGNPPSEDHPAVKTQPELCYGIHRWFSEIFKI